MRNHALKFGLWGGGYALLFVVFISYFLTPAYAASGSEAASFLDIPVGGRPAAMGDAYSALATDAYAMTSNPAGLGFLDSTQIAGQHLSYLESINYEYASIVHPLTKGNSIGASMQYLGSGDITQTNTSGDTVGSFTTHFAAYSLAYGHAFGDKFSLGATGKVIDAKIADVGAKAYAADLGSLYRVNDKLNLSAVLSNFGTKLTFLSDGGTLPLAFKLGAAYQPNPHYTFSVDGLYHGTGLTDAHIGVEWRPLELIAIRAGYRTDTTKELSAIAGFSTGLGLNVWGQELSYAWVPYGDLGNTQYFSLLIRFGQAEQEKRNLIKYETIKPHRTAKVSDPEYQQLMQLLTDGEIKEMYTRNAAPAGDAQ